MCENFNNLSEEIEARENLLNSLFGGIPPSGYAFDDYQVTSLSTTVYNCIAWAIGEEERERCWSPEPFQGYEWPQSIPKEETLETYIELFQLHGYFSAEDASLEKAFEKIAIYVKSGIPSHVSRQLDNGTWTSKLGKDHDITHTDLGCLEGNRYGFVQKILKRPRV
jgi:hypothetical protein